MLKASRALLSVYDKNGLAELAQGLGGLGIELLSTGGTYRELDARTARLAGSLQSIVAGPDIPIGICFERSMERLAATVIGSK